MRLEFLADNPQISKPRPEIDPLAFSAEYQSHVIYFLKAHNIILIFGVLHKRMVPTNHLQNRSRD